MPNRQTIHSMFQQPTETRRSLDRQTILGLYYETTRCHFVTGHQVDKNIVISTCAKVENSTHI